MPTNIGSKPIFLIQQKEEESFPKDDTMGTVRLCFALSGPPSCSAPRVHCGMDYSRPSAPSLLAYLFHVCVFSKRQRAAAVEGSVLLSLNPHLS